MFVDFQDTKSNDKKSLFLSILTFITKNPGIHFNDMQRALNLAPSTLQYHLNQMEKSNKIIIDRKEYYTRYFPATMKDPFDQKIMALLRQNIPRTLLLILLEQPGKTGAELKKLLKITKSTLSYYTKRLDNLGVLDIKSIGREKQYSVKNSERIKFLLEHYRMSFGDSMVDRFVEVWVRI